MSGIDIILITTTTLAIALCLIDYLIGRVLKDDGCEHINNKGYITNGSKIYYCNNCGKCLGTSYYKINNARHKKDIEKFENDTKLEND